MTDQRYDPPVLEPGEDAALTRDLCLLARPGADDARFQHDLRARLLQQADGSATATTASARPAVTRPATTAQGRLPDLYARRVGPIERLAGRLLRSPGLARALVTTPSLVVSWLVASAVVLAVGVVATAQTGVPWAELLAPALAGVGIAYAYGPGIDPAFELSQTMPISDRMVLLVRALAVFGVNTVLGGAASFVSVGAAGLTLGWLVPMTTVAALGLAAATLARSANVGVAAALAGWCIIVLASAVDTRDLAAAVVPGTLTLGYLAVTLACIATVMYAPRGWRMEGWSWR